MAQVTLRSKIQILSDLVRSISINTDITSVVAGSDVITLLEAISESLFQAEVNSLKILESIGINDLVGQALDKKAVSSKLPNGRGGFGRKPATQASGSVIIGSSFNKVSSKLYAGKPSPFAGSDTLYVENGTYFEFLSDGVTPIPLADRKIYLGRGTIDRFEGPIPYTTVVDNGSFWTITLSTAMTKSHLQSDLVVLAQGGDRSVGAGVVVQIKANSENPPINFTTTKKIVIPDGEAEGEVPVICTQFGEVGNALAGSITQFSGAPFTGATVTNRTSFRSGRSTENDEDLRQRIKNYPATLSRGTSGAIYGAIYGAVDPISGRSITSVKVLEPVEPGDVARVYIDDGTGLEPTFDEQASELLLNSASGQETRFRTAKFPITSSMAEGSEFAPFSLEAGMTLTVRIDEVLETYTVTPSNYKTLSSATAFEIVRDFNAQSNIVGFRTLDGGKRIVIIDLSGQSEQIEVSPSDLQAILGLPTAVLRPIFLYQDSHLLSFVGSTATLQMRPKGSWNLTGFDLTNLPVIVDGVEQVISITNADFTQYSTTVETSTIGQWVEVLSSKIAGVKFTAQGQILVWSTWQEKSSGGSLEIPELRNDGSPAWWVGEDRLWTPLSSGGKLSAAGSEKDFSFNRFTGEITLAAKPDAGSRIEIASQSTRAHIRSTVSETGLFVLDPLATLGNAKLIVGFDGSFELRTPVYITGLQVTPTIPDSVNASNVIRLTANDTQLFYGSRVGDWMYIVPDAVISSALPEAFYRLLGVGHQLRSTNLVTSGMQGETKTFSTINFTTREFTNLIKITQLSHGLKTGDLITVSGVVGTPGGIPAANINLTNVAITVLSDNEFVYSATATATSTASSTLTFGSNVVFVTHPAHGYSSGALVDVAVTTGFGGISNTDLSVLSAPITVIDLDTYEYRAAAAATSSATGQTINSVTYLADSWVEFEVSSIQLPSWTPLLTLAQSVTDGMFSIFQSTVIPQLVDFGASSSLTADQVVGIINDQISSGAAVKVSPQQVEVRTNNFDITGTAAILAAIGNAATVFEPTVSASMQAHIGESTSKEVQGGFPVISDISKQTTPALGYSTRTYLVVDRNMTEVISEAANPVIQTPNTSVPSGFLQPTYPKGFQHLWLTGRASAYSARVYNNQTLAPYTGILTGDEIIRPMNTFDNEQTSPDTLNRYANYGLRLQDVPLNNYDNFVVEMDLDPTDKTVSAPMSKIAKILDIDPISAGGAGSVISFRLKDPEDGDKSFFAVSSVYKDFNFVDFKILTKSVGLYREDVLSDRALILRSYDYGAPHQLRMAVLFPTSPDVADVSVSHSNDFYVDKSRVNLFVTLPSSSEIIAGTLGAGAYTVKATANATLFDWRISAPSLNSTNDYAVGNVLNISGTSQLSGSYYITSSRYGNYLAVTGTATPSSDIISVSQAAHGFQVGDLIDVSSVVSIGGISAANISRTFTPVTAVPTLNSFEYQAGAAAVPIVTFLAVTADTIIGFSTVTVTLVGHPYNTGDKIDVVTSTAIGGISAVQLSQTDTTVTKIDNDTFTYIAGAAATSTATGTLDSIQNHFVSNGTLTYVRGGSVDVKAPGSGGVLSVTAFDAAQSPVRTWDLVDKTIQDLADAINAYFPNSPIATAEAIGTAIATNYAAKPTYMLYPASSPYAGDDMSGAIIWHEFNTHYSGSAGIFQYDSSVLLSNNIKATVQNDEAIFPTTTEALGTSYLPVNEEVQIVPTNSTTLARWLSFRAVSSLNLLASIEKTNSDTDVQISSLTEGSAGAVKVTGVGANTLESFVISNATNIDDSTKLSSLKAAVRSLLRGQIINLENSLSSSVIRSYTTGNADYFRSTTALKYVRYDANTGRLIFLRNGKGPSQVEPLNAADTITLTNLGNGLVQVTSVGGDLVAAVGDMMYVQPSSPFPSDVKSYRIPSVTDGNDPEYLGYPVVHVIDNTNIIVIAPNITSFGLTALAASEDLVFLPAVWNEKNIKSNHASGAKFNELVNNNEAFYLVKNLGQGMTSLWLQNSATEDADTMELAKLSVSTDDLLVLGDGFNPSNRGTFRIIAHNGRNHIIFHNESAVDELIDANATSNGGDGQRNWRVGPLNNGNDRSVRVISGDSVRIGDKLRISAPSDSTQWFNDVFFGSWDILRIGMQALDYTGDPLPHEISDGVYDQNYLAVYIDFAMPQAPLSVVDNLNAPVDSFLIGNNTDSIGFTEGSPFSCYRMVSGHAVSPTNDENSDLFVQPNTSVQKLSSILGTKITAVNKMGYTERAFSGIDGYKTYDELVKLAHNIIDGLPENTTLYQGVKAAGAVIEVLTPLIRSVSISLQVAPKDGVTLNSITEVIKSAVAAYVNGLGVGQPVIESEVIKTVQSLPGVSQVSVITTTPALTAGRIVVSDIEKPFIFDISQDINVG